MSTFIRLSVIENISAVKALCTYGGSKEKGLSSSVQQPFKTIILDIHAYSLFLNYLYFYLSILTPEVDLGNINHSKDMRNSLSTIKLIAMLKGSTIVL